MIQPRPTNLLTSIANAVDLSQTEFDSIITSEKLKENCSSVYANEIGLDVDRSVESIGQFPSEFHNYQLLADGLSEYVTAVRFGAIQLEMMLKVADPENVLFTNPSFVNLPHEYITLGFPFNAYIPNDENLYRAENIYSNTESSLNVLDPLDIQNGDIPTNIDMIVTNGTYLSSNPNQNILSDLYSKLSSGGIILVAISNDYMNLYSRKNVHPMVSVHDQMKQLPDATVYHVPTAIGFTVIVKN